MDAAAKSVTKKAYTGQDADKYLEARRSSLSDYVQELRASVFLDLGSAESTILDFGCGSGGILKRLTAKQRIGVEIGEGAAELARSAGITVHSDLRHIPDSSVDIVISFHALEHVERPLDILREIGRVARPDARIRIVVPGETSSHSSQRSWYPNDDRHLYTWTPLLLGNLAERAGFREIETRAEPMPTRSRLVRMLSFARPLSRAAHVRNAKRRNAMNVILDAKPPLEPGADR